MNFEPRITKPEKGNKYYIRKADGGYSDAILGKPTDPDCNVLANCSGYSYGRFNEVGQYGSCKYLAPVNAGEFMDFKGDCETGFDPKLGACMVWRLNGSSSAGHVASVEAVIDNDTVITSESSYNGQAFYLKTRHRKDGTWEQDGYTFKGFIYNPAVENAQDWYGFYLELNAKYGALESELAAANEQMKLIKGEAKNLESALLAQNTAIAKAENNFKQAQLTIAAKDKRISELTEELQSLQKTHWENDAVAEKQIARLQQDLAEIEAKHQSEVQGYSKEIGKLNEKIAELNEQNETLQRIKGDINGDGRVNIADVFALIALIFSKEGKEK